MAAKKKVVIGLVAAGLALGAAVLLAWPHAPVSAQVNAIPSAQLSLEACTCSRPTTAGTGKEQLSIYYCTCPGMQCTVTATAASGASPPNVVQNCASAPR